MTAMYLAARNST